MKQKLPGDVELIMFSYNKYYTGVIFVSGRSIENELSDAYNENDWHDLLAEPPKPGIWVWQGILQPISYGEDFEGYEFNRGIIREPTEWEWHCLKLNESPWAARGDYGESELDNMIEDLENRMSFTSVLDDGIRCIMMDGKEEQ
ncbi:MAG TPA: hypothetical protein VNW06_00490 [Cytophagaceae bacterium]|jgi:hypothetical protein|nr:hypothetical protein [Cytophagaceae bacterium]